MKIMVSKNVSDWVSCRPGEIYDVLAHIRPRRTNYELVLIEHRAGARGIRESDEILYLHPGFLKERTNHCCWLRINCKGESQGEDEAAFIHIHSNEEALTFLKRTPVIE